MSEQAIQQIKVADLIATGPAGKRGDDKQAAKLVTGALRELAKRLDAAPEGRVRLAGFGVFRIKQVETKAGAKQRRMVVRLAPGKPGGAGKGKAGGGGAAAKSATR